jgi:hypothetical protein
MGAREVVREVVREEEEVVVVVVVVRNGSIRIQPAAVKFVKQRAV